MVTKLEFTAYLQRIVPYCNGNFPKLGQLNKNTKGIYIRSAHRQFRDLLVTNRSYVDHCIAKLGVKKLDEGALSKIL